MIFWLPFVKKYSVHIILIIYILYIVLGHGSRPPSASLPTPAALKKEPDEPQHRVKMEPHSQSGGDDNSAELGVDGIKTEIDGLMDSDGK